MNGKCMDKGDSMPKIYERNPDTDEVRERDFNDYQEAADSMRDMNRDDHLNRDKQPSSYRNEMAEAVEILKRIDSKLQYICEVGVSKSDTTPYSTWKDMYE